MLLDKLHHSVGALLHLQTLRQRERLEGRHGGPSDGEDALRLFDCPHGCRELCIESANKVFRSRSFSLTRISGWFASTAFCTSSIALPRQPYRPLGSLFL